MAPTKSMFYRKYSSFRHPTMKSTSSYGHNHALGGETHQHIKILRHQQQRHDLTVCRALYVHIVHP